MVSEALPGLSVAFTPALSRWERGVGSINPEKRRRMEGTVSL
jgi:hypothetical protein